MSPTRTLRIDLQFDGTDFEGWQLQPGGRRTVQGCLASAVERICGAAPRVTGSGRTDAGVHARGQVVHFDAALPDSLRPLRHLNHVLPPDIRVKSCQAVPPEFDARFSALSRK